MLDYLHLPDNTGGNIDYFSGFSDTEGGSWVVWEKPRGAHMIRITCIGGGGGGGSGFSSNTTNARGGGGGGGSSAISIVTIPAYVLPDRLYVSSGIGGKGGDANPADGTANLGSDGIASLVCIAPDAGVIYTVCYTYAGRAGTTLPTATPTGGTGGSGGQVATIADMLLASYGIRDFIAGQGGSAGSATGSISVTYPTTGLLLSGGAGGGGGTNTDGGSVIAPTQTVYNIFPVVDTVVGSGNNGEPGREIYQPLLGTGGSGGAANNSTGSGGTGGAGGFGSGGGGGGAGGAGAAGGGGKGGNGLVIIHSW